MSEDGHNIGKILGCIVFALGCRELISFIHRLIVGSTMFHVPLFEIFLISIGIGGAVEKVIYSTPAYMKTSFLELLKALDSRFPGCVAIKILQISPSILGK